MGLSKETTDQIKDAADEYVRLQGSHDKPDITHHDYTQGATAWAAWKEKAEALEKQLAAALLSGEDWKEDVKIPEGEKVAYVPGWAALRSAVCEMLMDNINTDEPYLAIGNKTFTRSQLANEVMNGTDHGLKIMESLIKLTIDSIRRGKSVMPKNLNQ